MRTALLALTRHHLGLDKPRLSGVQIISHLRLLHHHCYRATSETSVVHPGLRSSIALFCCIVFDVSQWTSLVSQKPHACATCNQPGDKDSPLYQCAFCRRGYHIEAVESCSNPCNPGSVSPPTADATKEWCCPSCVSKGCTTPIGAEPPLFNIDHPESNNAFITALAVVLNHVGSESSVHHLVKPQHVSAVEAMCKQYRDRCNDNSQEYRVVERSAGWYSRSTGARLAANQDIFFPSPDDFCHLLVNLVRASASKQHLLAHVVALLEALCGT